MTDRVDALLDDAIAAARVSADDGVTDGAATRLRLRESLSRRRSPRKIITIIAAVIATMFGSTAFAYYVGGWRPSWIESPTPETPVVVVAEPAAAVEPRMPARTVRREVVPIEVEPLEPPAKQPAPKIQLPQPRVEQPRTEQSRVEPQASPHVEQSAAAIEPPGTATSSRAPTSTSTSGTTSAPRTDTPAPPERTPDPELAAYRVAHEAHFRGNDPKAALKAWDAYLAKFPNGRLVLEARYDRALILIKLRRFSDARAALKPFAEGTYRRDEAIKLLAAIQNR